MPEQITPIAPTLVDLLRDQADRLGDKVAFSYCPDGDVEESRVTYRELDRKARAIGAQLQQEGATGQRVLVICRPGLDGIAGIFGCFYAGAVAVPVDDHWVSQRIEAVVPDAQARYAVATAKSMAKWLPVIERLSDGPALAWLAMDDITGEPETWVPPALAPDTTAFLQYTSGSTGAPKGVMLSHHNVLTNLEAGYRLRDGLDSAIYDSPVTGVSWLPHYQQMGLVGAILGLLYVGGTNVLMSPGSFLIRPLRWLEAISRFRAVISPAPNFAYDWCVKRSNPAQRAELDLSSWSVAVTGGEPVHAETLRAFAEAFAPAGFRPEAFIPVYGQAEVTLGLTGMSDSALPVVRHVDRGALAQDRVVEVASGVPEAAAVVGCGHIQGGHDVIIVDPETRRRCQPDQVGEIWIAGPSVGQGYWGKPVETERTFRAFLDTGEGPFLRTGDLAFVRGGEVFVVGRQADLIVVDGYHHYPNDIEATVQAQDPALLPGRGAVFCATPDPAAGEQLIVVQELQRHRDRDAELSGIIDAIRAAVRAQHGLDVHAVLLVKPMRVPTTPTGKVQRGQCRQQFLDGQLAVVTEWHAPPPPLDPQTTRARKQVGVGLAGLISGALAARRQQGTPRG